MHDFEFQRYVTVGQYLDTGSPLHRLDPRTRLIAGSLLLGVITGATHPGGLAIALFTVFVALLIARIPLTYALRGLLAPLPFILFLALLQIVIGPHDDKWEALLSVGPLHITAAKLITAAMIVTRFVALVLLISLTSATISTSELVSGMQALLRPLTLLGLPTQDVVLMTQVALRFLPLLALEAERIAKAQASRGAEWGTGRAGILRRVRQILPVLVPLFLSSLERAEALAVAMEARGYPGDKNRTAMRELHFRPKDAGILFLVVIICALILFI